MVDNAFLKKKLLLVGNNHHVINDEFFLKMMSPDYRLCWKLCIDQHFLREHMQLGLRISIERKGLFE